MGNGDPRPRTTRSSRLFVATVALGLFAFLGGRMAERSIREPLVLLDAFAMIAAFLAVLWFGSSSSRREGDDDHDRDASTDYGH